MPKRKRDEEQLQDNSGHKVQDSFHRSRHVRIEQILGLGKNSVFQSLKLARGFERQKLGRRAKLAKGNNATEEIARLEAEVTALKTLDMAAIAEMHIYKSVLKYKTIFSSLVLPHYITTKVQSCLQPQDTAHANVQARLFNSKPVKTAVDEVIENIRGMLGIEGVQPVRRKRLRAADFTGMNVDGTIEPSKRNGTIQNDVGVKGSPASSDDNAEDSSPAWEGLSSDSSDSASDSDNDMYTAYASRLAQSDEDTASEDAMAAPAGYFSKTSYERPPDDSISLSPPRSLTPEISSSSKTNITKTSSSTPKSTTFLPSLMMGGYWSGSESAEDDDASQLGTRKNRRGQQARRALWEKKFGRNANHLKKQAKDPNQGWDPRKGASDTNDVRGERGKGRGGSSMRSNGIRGIEKVVRSGANNDPIKMRERKSKPVEGPLHPSWVAAKKAKEVKAAVAFQGKKVVFD